MPPDNLLKSPYLEVCQKTLKRSFQRTAIPDYTFSTLSGSPLKPPRFFTGLKSAPDAKRE
ncbi:MAG: hypothetical protein A2270_11440 [Elusimicrobia bacterium RIFOXYA12_FULL_51_18]|nr:MAG: hypothetical protein A2270_11440 [Elusimicrobia bacterium RIFOXYA12_FULL_51_18]OGS30247.1 MAG: hypothetical protein A2218_12200 [Elusimicrobia bacterium RIFOXYA2_FULL_53_38]